MYVISLRHKWWQWICFFFDLNDRKSSCDYLLSWSNEKCIVALEWYCVFVVVVVATILILLSTRKCLPVYICRLQSSCVCDNSVRILNVQSIRNHFIYGQLRGWLRLLHALNAYCMAYIRATLTIVAANVIVWTRILDNEIFIFFIFVFFFCWI